ncbi:4'-phosphopantetheinyl transferase family protein [Streptomyces albipurpureus]|uniref:4'-phosphopantetheinyl transferase superfamily protein n=1 Tax=Streptomyces albipurpureus TaxID=2897419 RepID=A0ABT0US16_9ACTN|nr:4'-phosphopantetheinyl transferase superfamily protein [Streptomyces sp. CWNU-1]MCM2391244.1 4'-phosphopantetheinyl transferase superfamily protein [Streptomyces sp. CWNU-1]
MATEAPISGGQRTPPPGVEVLWIARVGEHAADAMAHRDLLDAEESARLDGFVRPGDRDAYAVGHVALRRLLGDRLGRAPEAVVLGRNPCTSCGDPHGRPIVPGDPVHFSLSHTRGMVLIALASAPVGVDVEVLPRPETVADITPQLHPTERLELAELPAEGRSLAFARCWTRKESVLKARGVGLNEELSRTYVGAGPQPAVDPVWLLADVPVDPGFAAAVAVRRVPMPPADPLADSVGDIGE